MKKAVRDDVRSYFKAMADKAEALQNSGNTHLWAKQARALGHGAGAEPKHSLPSSGLVSQSGVLLNDVHQIVNEFERHFVNILQNNGDSIDDSVMDSLVSKVERISQEEDDDDMAEIPSFDEVKDAVHSLRNLAAPSLDNITAPLLKSCDTAIKFLHRLIASVWKTGRAPAAWKRALLVPLYKEKGDPKLADNYRGISLLSIPGKAYATIILRRIRRVAEGPLHEAQCGFRAGRGTTDAMFTLRCLVSSSINKQQDMHLAFIDLTKAFDSVNRAALFKVLRLSGVHSRLVALLEDLHSGTDAVIRLEDELSSNAHVHKGVRTGVRTGALAV